MATIGVFAAIFDEHNRALLVRQAYGQKRWTQPGGRLEDNESPIDGVIREVFEETGVHAEVVKFCGTYLAEYKNDIVLMFQLRIIDTTPRAPDDEIADIQFFGITELPQPMAFNSRTRVLHSFDPNPPGLTVFNTPDSIEIVY